uniref:Uncharacterized protein n=1 Tax=Mycena chlorophos TaxID=658473 RepID=A0ABQ0LVA5_MYCCL|nr:predicted protein [Mycena chlorophos]
MASPPSRAQHGEQTLSSAANNHFTISYDISCQYHACLRRSLLVPRPIPTRPVVIFKHAARGRAHVNIPAATRNGEMVETAWSLILAPRLLKQCRP